MRPLDFFQRANVEYLEAIHEQYLQDPDSIDREWALFFAGFEAGSSESPVGRGSAPSHEESSPAAPQERQGTAPSYTDSPQLLDGVQNLVHSYRELGHFQARLDPLGTVRKEHPLLQLDEFGLTEKDLSREVGTGTFAGPTDGTLGSLLEQLRATYCGTLGVEFMDIADKTQREWLEARMEPSLNRPQFSRKRKLRILSHLITAETFETFLHTKYVGQKRFSVEGAESLIALLNAVIDEAAAFGVRNW